MFDFKPMVKFMKDCFDKYGLWQIALFAILLLTFWQLADVLEAVSKIIQVLKA